MLATKHSDLLNVDMATPRRSSCFSLNISLKWLWKKDYEQALRNYFIMPEYISAEGLEKLKQELYGLKTTKRQEIAVRLEHAKSLGDLSENAEYQETKEEQTLVEQQIAALEETIRHAIVIKSERPMDVVTVGSTVVVDSGRGSEAYKIVGSEEAKPAEGKISNESPLGKAFLNRRVGNTVEVKTPGGVVGYKILEIK